MVLVRRILSGRSFENGLKNNIVLCRHAIPFCVVASASNVVIDLGHHVKSDDSRSACTFQRIERFNDVSLVMISLCCIGVYNEPTLTLSYKLCPSFKRVA